MSKTDDLITLSRNTQCDVFQKCTRTPSADVLAQSIADLNDCVVSLKNELGRIPESFVDCPYSIRLLAEITNIEHLLVHIKVRV